MVALVWACAVSLRAEQLRRLADEFDRDEAEPVDGHAYAASSLHTSTSRCALCDRTRDDCERGGREARSTAEAEAWAREHPYAALRILG